MNAVASHQAVDVKNSGLKSKFLILGALTLSLGTGRWGSYIPIIPGTFYFIDFLLLIGVLISFPKSLKSLTGLVYYFSILIFIWIGFSRGSEHSFQLLVRDSAPFLYLALLPALISGVRQIQFKDFIYSIRIGAIINLAWFLPSSLGLLKPLKVSFLEVPLFLNRSDHNGIVMALGVLFWSLRINNPPKFQRTTIVSLIIGVLLSNSRASLACLVFVLSYILLTRRKDLVLWQSRRFLAILILLGITVSPILLTSTVGKIIPKESVLKRVGLFEDNSEVEQFAKSTANARLYAWRILLEWSGSESNVLIGVGPGVEMVKASGAVRYLSGRDEVRSPHNWIVACIARFGISGLIFWLIIVFASFLRQSRENQSAILRVSILIICISSLFGVVIESPFGSLPLAIFVAKLYSMRVKR